MFIASKDFLDEKSKYIISNFEGKLRKDQITFFIENCMAGEEELAYKILCEQIYEDDIKIPRKVFEILKEMCIYYEIDDEYWKDLEDLVIY